MNLLVLLALCLMISIQATKLDFSTLKLGRTTVPPQYSISYKALVAYNPNQSVVPFQLIKEGVAEGLPVITTSKVKVSAFQIIDNIIYFYDTKTSTLFKADIKHEGGPIQKVFNLEKGCIVTGLVLVDSCWYLSTSVGNLYKYSKNYGIQLLKKNLGSISNLNSLSSNILLFKSGHNSLYKYNIKTNKFSEWFQPALITKITTVLVCSDKVYISGLPGSYIYSISLKSAAVEIIRTNLQEVDSIAFLNSKKVELLVLGKITSTKSENYSTGQIIKV